MIALQRLCITAAAGFVLSIPFAGQAARGAGSELNWKSGGEAAPVSYQEPLGGRIDAAPTDNDVVPASAQEHVAPGQWNPQRSRAMAQQQQPVRQSVRPAAWQAPPGSGSSVPGYQSPRSNAPAWQGQSNSRSDIRMAARPRFQGSVTYAPDGPMPDSGEIIESDGGEIVEGMPGEMIDGANFDGSGGCGGCGDDCDDGCCLLSCPKCPPGCIPAPTWPNNLDLLVGVQGFKGPLDQGRNGNFGFHEGFNVGGHVWLAKCLSYQFGGTWTQQNFHGDQTPDFYREESRQQVFGTAGLFIRADNCLPWQGGVVVDWLHDDYGVEYNVGQVRAEISRVGCFGNEFGFMGAFRIREDEVNLNNIRPQAGDVTLQTVDQFCLFVRTHFDNCGEGRLWGGATGDGDGIFGGDYRIPLSDSFLLQGNFNYLITRNGEEDGQRDEAWGISLELVFQPFCRARRSMSDRNRPLFNVADNSRLIVEPK
ncbi:MAG: hypothetical protein K8T91_06595 [Planctomycetes bacterium]|nr:hypothetical protein [Planctomycetota bacterium]